MSRATRDTPRAARAAALLLALALGAPAALPAAAQENEPVSLRLEGRRGEESAYRYQQEIDLQMPPEFGGAQRIDSRLVVHQRVDRADESAVRYLAEVREIEVEMESPPTMGELDFSRFEGQRFRMTLDRRGRLEGVEPVDEAGPGLEQLQQTIRQAGFPVLPPRPVRVGESWVDTTRVDATAMALPAAGEIVSVSRTTLVGVERAGGRRTARLAVETEFHFRPDAGAVPGMRVEVTGTRQDDVRFDIDRGRFLDATGLQRFEMSMALPGAPSALSIEGTARSRTELLPGS